MNVYRACCLVCLVALLLAIPLFLTTRRHAAPSPPVTAVESLKSATPRSFIRGQVVDEAKPLSAARVRIKGHAVSTVTDEQGRFSLPAPATRPLRIAAWKHGYLIAGVAVDDKPLQIQLKPLPASDNSDYRWVDPAPDEASEHNCGNCHRNIYDEWKSTGHATAAQNRQFANLYEGTDWNGNAGHGWSLIDEHPDGAGVCAACHAPGIHFESGASNDMRSVTGVASDGVHCDFCHKVVNTEPGDFGLMHGRFALQLLRPHEGQLFFGPLDDVDRGEDSYSPLQSESSFCASCHEGVVFGIHVYSTYSEWLESPAATAGKSCQMCHMAPTGEMSSIAHGTGAIRRDPDTLASHSLMPHGQKKMLRKCVTIGLTFAHRPTSIECTVTLVAEGVGHYVPTGFIDRHLLMVVEPLGRAGERLKTETGPRLPEYAGLALVDRPGRLFGRILADDSGASPAAFWNAIEQRSDTRLKPNEPDYTRFEFPNATRRVRVQILYRRFWQQVAREKQWPDDTLVIHDKTWIVR